MPTWRAATFPDEKTAEWAVASAIEDQQSAIDQWVAGDSDEAMILNYDTGVTIGRVMLAPDLIVDATGVRVVLYPTDAMPMGWRVHTAYPCDSVAPHYQQLAFLMYHFHDDWDLDHDGDPDAVVTDFVRRAPVERLRAVVADMDVLLELGLDEETLERVLVDDLQANYRPTADGRRMSSWLTHMRDQLRVGLA